VGRGCARYHRRISDCASSGKDADLDKRILKARAIGNFRSTAFRTIPFAGVNPTLAQSEEAIQARVQIRFSDDGSALAKETAGIVEHGRLAQTVGDLGFG
jgi:hypothetical protein